MSGNDNLKNFRQGHRERLRKRFLENSIDALAEHEILEMILFYSIPRVDTKPIAYKLIEEFGSLEAVLSAPYESLTAYGLTSACAAYLKLFNNVPSWISRNNIVGKTVSGYNEIGNIFLQELKGDKTERVVMLMLDCKNRVICLKTVCTGSFTGTKIETHILGQSAILKGASKVAIAHNHPGGKKELSLSDHMTTGTLENLFSMLDVEFLEHYIVTDDSFYGIYNHKEHLDKTGEAIYLKNHGYHTDT